MIELTNKQEEVLNQIHNFIQSDASVFILRGYAGTGKTTMIQAIERELSKSRTVKLMAPTGRAARVLAERTGKEARTIHKSIYALDTILIKEDKDNSLGYQEFKYVFSLGKTEGKVVAIVDEASMLASKTNCHELYLFGTGNLMNDLLTFVRPSFGGKLIFVGDPAQLPPVGEIDSNALSREFFEEKGLKVMEAELTEVLRQTGDSVILKNAMLIRDILKEEKRNYLVFEEKADDVEVIKPENFINKVISDKKAGESNSVVICYSNRSAYNYNKEIREAIYETISPTIREGDVLMVAQNNYSLDIMNGEFVKVADVGEIIHQSAPVFVQRGASRERVIIQLSFVQVTIVTGGENPLNCLLLLDLLNNGEPGISIEHHIALYINFCMRHPELKPGSEQFAGTLKLDSYYNCLKAKYGYAATGHKCQGGEWDKVYVDYSGRTGLSNDCLRWAYTATTRARKTLYIANLPHITPFSKFRIEQLAKCNGINEEFRVIGDIEKSPFHSESAPKFLHAKYGCILNNMRELGVENYYNIVRVDSKPYKEIYFINTPLGMMRFDLMYKKGGLFLPAKRESEYNQHTVILEEILNNESAMPIVLKYEPCSETHERLFNLIRSSCDSLNILITNVVDHPEDYSVMYYFRTSNTSSYIKIYIDQKGFISYAKPMSLLGQEDYEFEALINDIKTHFI